MKTKIKKRQDGKRKKCAGELFPSMTQPLREALDARHDLRQKDLEFDNVERRGLFADEISKKGDKITEKINSDPFSLRALLCDEEAYTVMQQMTDKQEKKVRCALLFLRAYSLLIKNGYFEMSSQKDTSAIITFAQKHVPSSLEIRESIASGDYRPLIEALISKVEKEIELVKPLLKDFVQSDFFEKKSHRERAHLFSSTEKRTLLCEEEERQRRVKSGELILFSMNFEKDEASPERTRKSEERRDSLEASTQKAKRGKNLLKVAGLIVPALKIVGILIPCLALTAIPGVGFLLSLTCCVVLGAAVFTYYMAPEYKKGKRDKKARKEKEWEEEVFLQNTESAEIRRERRKIVTPKTEKMVIASPLMDDNPPSPKDIKPSLGGGQWLKEDRKRREQLPANDKVNHRDKDNGVYQSFPNINHGRGKSM